MRDFRLDRALSVRLARPFLRMTNAAKRPRIPILMYHGIREPEGTSYSYFETCTSAKVFDGHLRYLRRKGYATIGLGEAVSAVAAGRCLKKSVVITFDDGYRDFYTTALPMLSKYGFGATVFVVSGFVQREREGSGPTVYMNWDQVREIHGRGIQIGSHTASHPELARLSAAEADLELGRSKNTMEDELGSAIDAFSYPYAFPEHNHETIARLRSSLQAHGYQYGVCTTLGMAGPGSDRFFLPRLPVNSYDDLELFAAKLEGAYDWLHLAQSVYKRFVVPVPMPLDPVAD